MLPHEPVLLCGENFPGFLPVQHGEEGFGVGHLGSEGAAQKNVSVPIGIQQRRDRIVFLHHIRRHRPAVDSVNLVALRCQQPPVLVPERPDVDDLGVNSFLPEPCGELVELRHVPLIQKIHDGHRQHQWHLRMLFPVVGVQLQKGLYPAVEQLVAPKPVLPADGLMGRVPKVQLVQMEILVHGAGSVRVDLAELEVPGILVIENIEAGHRQFVRIPRIRQNQLLQLLRKAKALPIFRIRHVAIDHLAADSVSHLHDIPKPPVVLPGIHLLYRQGLVDQAPPGNQRSMLQLFFHRLCRRPVFFVMFLQLADVIRIYLFP